MYLPSVERDKFTFCIVFCNLHRLGVHLQVCCKDFSLFDCKSRTCEYNVQSGCFLTKVLSKEEHVAWWVVRALKTDSIGFVPASFLNRAAEEVTLGSALQVSVRHSNRTETRHLVHSGLMLYTEYSCVDLFT